jgi:transposase-like protein
MVWREVSMADLRREFVLLALLSGTNVSALCERFGISRQTGHLWLQSLLRVRPLSKTARGGRGIVRAG